VNLVDYLFQAAEKLSRWQQPAIAACDRSVSYEQLYGLVKKCCGMMKSLGVRSGDRVAIMAADCPEWVISFLGVIAAGAVAVPASTMSSASELQ